MSIEVSRQHAARPAYVSWAECYVARVQGAAAFLRERGFGVRRLNETTFTWAISAHPGEYSDGELVALATMRGYAA